MAGPLKFTVTESKEVLRICNITGPMVSIISEEIAIAVDKHISHKPPIRVDTIGEAITKRWALTGPITPEQYFGLGIILAKIL